MATANGASARPENRPEGAPRSGGCNAGGCSRRRRAAGRGEALPSCCSWQKSNSRKTNERHNSKPLHRSLSRNQSSTLSRTKRHAPSNINKTTSHQQHTHELKPHKPNGDITLETIEPPANSTRITKVRRTVGSAGSGGALRALCTPVQATQDKI